MKQIFKDYITTIIKYLIAIGLVVYSSIFYGTYPYLLFGLFELIIVFSVSQFALSKNKVLGNIISGLLLFAFMVDYIIYIFCDTFFAMIMLENISQLMTLGSSLFIYIPSVLVLLVIAFLPTKEVKFKRRNYLLLLIIPYLLLNIFFNNRYSVYKNYVVVGKQCVNKIIIKHKMNKYQSSTRFNSHSDSDNKNYKVKNNPNVIIIFTEGLSKHVIEDERNIMPNTKKYMNESINFDNYYNHTAATFRGVMGQLYSGYQYENLDHNSLVGMHDMLKEHGYTSEFINIELRNKDWTNYVYKLNFDTVKTIDNKPYLTDEEGYDLLYDEAIRLNKEDEPFILGIYTMETHTGWEVKTNKYGDGKSKMLNKYYNNDVQFGKFMDKYKNSELYKNTIIVYTTDHATYADWDYNNTFKDNNRECIFLDEIPFFIYYKGVKPITIDVDGRNSLDMAPTVLDLLDIFGDNAFLGDSLFDSNNTSKYDHYFAYPGVYYSTFNSKIKNEEKNKEFIEDTIEYCAVARKG